jgi:hypothetical protein
VRRKDPEEIVGILDEQVFGYVGPVIKNKTMPPTVDIADQCGNRNQYFPPAQSLQETP